jgi:ABC-type nitrate/sulfonate/bicarbonate transport system substrate-binding protein
LLSVGLVDQLAQGRGPSCRGQNPHRGDNFNLSYLAVGVAIKRGFFKDERLDVEVIRMNTPNTVTAMIAGDVGYTMLFGSVIRAALRHAAARHR